MSGPLTVAEWLQAGGIGVGVLALHAVAVKAGADGGRAARPKPGPSTAPVLEAPPRPSYPPSTGRHAGPAPADEARLLTPAPVSIRKGQPAWT